MKKLSQRHLAQAPERYFWTKSVFYWSIRISWLVKKSWTGIGIIRVWCFCSKAKKLKADGLHGCLGHSLRIKLPKLQRCASSNHRFWSQDRAGAGLILSGDRSERKRILPILFWSIVVSESLFLKNVWPDAHKGLYSDFLTLLMII